MTHQATPRVRMRAGQCGFVIGVFSDCGLYNDPTRWRTVSSFRRETATLEFLYILVKHRTVRSRARTRPARDSCPASLPRLCVASHERCAR
jgi:hypothetical protein